MTLNFPATIEVSNAIGMSSEQIANDPRRASILAGRYLRMLGYERKYNHAAWDRGMRWFSPNSDVALQDATNITILGYVLA